MNKPDPRNLIGLIVLISGLTLYAGMVGWLAEAMGEMPLALEVIFYVTTGIIWIFPAKALMKWMTRHS